MSWPRTELCLQRNAAQYNEVSPVAGAAQRSASLRAEHSRSAPCRRGRRRRGTFPRPSGRAAAVPRRAGSSTWRSCGGGRESRGRGILSLLPQRARRCPPRYVAPMGAAKRRARGRTAPGVLRQRQRALIQRRDVPPNRLGAGSRLRHLPPEQARGWRRQEGGAAARFGSWGMWRRRAGGTGARRRSAARGGRASCRSCEIWALYSSRLAHTASCAPARGLVSSWLGG